MNSKESGLVEKNNALTSQITLTFNNGRMTFFRGCNRIGRNYDLEQHTLRFTGDIGSTLKFCPQLHQK
ncbi:META domain-containing protein [Acinetobacter sp. YH12097]|uniref:META domain-containing protein n=1 Tax=Acinetobacter TaxID=469 RepID=UPI0035A070D5